MQRAVLLGHLTRGLGTPGGGSKLGADVAEAVRVGVTAGVPNAGEDGHVDELAGLHPVG